MAEKARDVLTGVRGRERLDPRRREEARGARHRGDACLRRGRSVEGMLTDRDMVVQVLAADEAGPHDGQLVKANSTAPWRLALSVLPAG
jgi:hypothetical protein